MRMPEATVTFDGVTEMSVQEMLDRLRRDIDSKNPWSVRSRSAAILLDVMPGFIRALTRENTLFQHQVAERHCASPGNETHILDAHLMVMALPIINMLASTIVGLVPNRNDGRGLEIRRIMINNLLENIRSEVEDCLLKDGYGKTFHA